MEAKSWQAIKPEAFGVKLLIAFGKHADNIPFPCRSLWTSATSAYFLAVAEAGNFSRAATGSEFRSGVFRSKCGIWKRLFAYLCSASREADFY